jgi:hypothetical protein
MLDSQVGNLVPIEANRDGNVGRSVADRRLPLKFLPGGREMLGIQASSTRRP